MKRKMVLCLTVALIFAFSTGCTTVENNNGVKNVEDKTTEASNANIEETIILDKNGVKVTAKSIAYDGWLGPEIKVLVENNSEKNITIQARKFSVNDLMVEPIFSVDVQAGKKANDTITILSTSLKESKIETIKDIEFSLSVSESNSFKTWFVEDGIKLQTGATDYIQKYNTEGTLVVNQNDIKVYVLKKDDKESFWGADIYVYVENNSKQNITVQARDVSIDGFMVDPLFSVDVVAGKKAYDTITFLESDLKNNDIEDIKEIELKFHIFNEDSWKTILDTPAKKISF